MTKQNSITTKKEFLIFLDNFRQNLQEHPEELENKDLSSFLEAMQAWIEDMGGYYKNMHQKLPTNISWDIFTDILRAAKIYEQYENYTKGAYSMKIKIALTSFLFFLFSPFSYAKDCKDMVGTYRVIPFIEPVGLSTLSTNQISESLIGTPIFEIKVNNNQTAQHIGLIHKKVYQITLKPTDQNIVTNADILFGHSISSCSYDLGYDSSITQVDLTKLNKQQLNQDLTYITQTWLSRLPDPRKERNKFIQSHYDIQYYKLDIQSLRQIQYFFIKKYPNLTGIKSLAYIIPLQKTTDKAQLTPIQRSPITKK